MVSSFTCKNFGFRISDCEFDNHLGIRAIALGASSYACKNCQQFPRLPQEPIPLLDISELGFVADLKPKATLRTFLLYNPDLMYKVCARFCSIRFSVVCSHGCAGLDELIFDDRAGSALRKSCHKRDYL